MKVQKIIIKNNRKYIFVEEYENFLLYKDMITGAKEGFNRQELGLIKEKIPGNKNLQMLHKI